MSTRLMCLTLNSLIFQLEILWKVFQQNNVFVEPAPPSTFNPRLLLLLGKNSPVVHCSTVGQTKSIQVIESYRHSETLWNVHCPDYHNRVKRKEANERLLNECDKSGTL